MDLQPGMAPYVFLSCTHANQERARAVARRLEVDDA